MVSSTILQASSEWVIHLAPHWTEPCHPEGLPCRGRETFIPFTETLLCQPVISFTQNIQFSTFFPPAGTGGSLSLIFFRLFASSSDVSFCSSFVSAKGKQTCCPPSLLRGWKGRYLEGLQCEICSTVRAEAAYEWAAAVRSSLLHASEDILYECALLAAGETMMSCLFWEILELFCHITFFFFNSQQCGSQLLFCSLSFKMRLQVCTGILWIGLLIER